MFFEYKKDGVIPGSGKGLKNFHSTKISHLAFCSIVGAGYHYLKTDAYAAKKSLERVYDFQLYGKISKWYLTWFI